MIVTSTRFTFAIGIMILSFVWITCDKKIDLKGKWINKEKNSITFQEGINAVLQQEGESGSQNAEYRLEGSKVILIALTPGTAGSSSRKSLYHFILEGDSLVFEKIEIKGLMLDTTITGHEIAESMNVPFHYLTFRKAQ